MGMKAKTRKNALPYVEHPVYVETAQDLQARVENSLSLADFQKSLKPVEQMLVVLRDDLYQGKWEIMALDLKNRFEGPLMLPLLEERLLQDLARVEYLMRAEQKFGQPLQLAPGQDDEWTND